MRLYEFENYTRSGSVVEGAGSCDCSVRRIEVEI